MTKYYRELWNKGPVRDEARRIAKSLIEEDYRKRGGDPRNITTNRMEMEITRLLFGSEDVLLKRAKWNLENQS